MECFKRGSAQPVLTFRTNTVKPMTGAGKEENVILRAPPPGIDSTSKSLVISGALVNPSAILRPVQDQ